MAEMHATIFVGGCNTLYRHTKGFQEFNQTLFNSALMPQDLDSNIIILGGGPAGSCMALRLLGLGYNVVLIEEKSFPRQQIGESLSGGVYNLLKYLDASHLLEQSGCLRNMVTNLLWESMDVTTRPSHGMMVDRAKLDANLIGLAEQRGLSLFQPATLLSCDKVEDKWQITFEHHGQQVSLHGLFIIDARGRRGIRNEQKVSTAPASVAIWTDIDKQEGYNETIVEALDNGWLWASPVSTGKFRLMAFLDSVSIAHKKPGEVLSGLIDRSILLKGVSRSTSFGDVRSCIASVYCHADPWQDNYLPIGEAVFAIDPLSSSGVEVAIRFSLQVAIVINTILKSGQNKISKEFYEYQVVESVCNNCRISKDYYAKAWPASENPFWNTRVNFQPKATNDLNSFAKNLVNKINEPIITGDNNHEAFAVNGTANWDTKAIVSPEVIYRPMPCVVNDRLELKMAVKTPLLNREIAYVNEIEITPMLRMISGSTTMKDAIHLWSNFMPMKNAAVLAVHLWNQGVLCRPEK